MMELDDNGELERSNGRIVYRPPVTEPPHECTPPSDWSYMRSLPIGTEWQCNVDGWRRKLYDRDLVGEPASPVWDREPAVYHWWRVWGWKVPIMLAYLVFWVFAVLFYWFSEVR